MQVRPVRRLFESATRFAFVLLLASGLGGCAERREGGALPVSKPTANCPVTFADLEVRHHRGMAERLFQAVPERGDASLFFDSAERVSYVFVEGDRPRAWMPGSTELIVLGRDRRLRNRVPEPGRREREKKSNLIGVIGADALDPPYTALDLGGGRFTTFACAPPETQGSAKMPLSFVGGVPITELEVDGRVLKLILDTGTADLLLLVDEEPRDAKFESTDLGGGTIRFAYSKASVRWSSGLVRRVPVWKTAHDGAFESHRKALGVHLDGLLGLSTFENAKLVFRRPEGRIEVIHPRDLGH
jgi:hypothetical protein